MPTRIDVLRARTDTTIFVALYDHALAWHTATFPTALSRDIELRMEDASRTWLIPNDDAFIQLANDSGFGGADAAGAAAFLTSDPARNWYAEIVFRGFNETASVATLPALLTTHTSMSPIAYDSAMLSFTDNDAQTDDATIVVGDLANDTGPTHIVDQAIFSEEFTGNDLQLPGAPVGPTTGDDNLVGTENDDTVDLLSGNDSFLALGGNDTVLGAIGNDVLIGGEGNDSLVGGSGNDTIDGETGNDTIDGGLDDDWLKGEDGDDLMFGGEGNDSLDGGSGNDSMIGGDGNDTMSGGDGIDIMIGGNDDDVMDGGNGNDNMGGSLGNDTMLGGDGDDFMGGGDGNDNITGGAGADTMDGGNGDDSMDGGSGNDFMWGFSGNDTMEGGGGSDRMTGGNGDDTFIISSAADGAGDVIVGGDGTDEETDYDVLDLSGAGIVRIDQTGDETDLGATTGAVTFEDGRSMGFSQIEAIIVDGLAVVDGIVDGLDTGENIAPGFVDLAGDSISATDPNVINGNGGDDTLSGGSGNDSLFGGAGADVFVFDLLAGRDTISDFEDGVDLIDVSAHAGGGTYAILSTLSPISVTGASPVVINMDDGTVINIAGTASDYTLSPDDFIFV